MSLFFQKPFTRGIRRMLPSSGKNINIDPIFKSANPEDLVIPVMGLAGVGKSTFISTLTSPRQNAVAVEIEHGLKSCTTAIQAIPFTIDHGSLRGRRVVMVDTPGFDDTYTDDAEILKRIALWLSLSYHMNMKLAGVIYLYDISQTRMFGTTRTNLKLFQELCGTEALNAVVLVTTKWGGEADRVKDVERERELTDFFWKEMLQAGSQISRFDLSEICATAIFNMVCENYLKRTTPTILHIQKEIVDVAKKIPDTMAGKNLRYTLEEVTKNPGAYDTAEPQKALHQLKDLATPLSR